MTEIVIGVIIGLITAFIVTGGMKASMVTAKKQTSAKNFIRRGSFNLTHNADHFIDEDIVRTRKEKDKD